MSKLIGYSLLPAIAIGYRLINSNVHSGQAAKEECVANSVQDLLK